MPPTLVELAKNPIKVGDHAPAWRFTVSGQDLSDKLIEAEVTFSSSGESGMTFTVAHTPLYHQSRERDFCVLEIGYGGTLAPFFMGRLSQPRDHRSGLYCEATAYGPSGDLGSRYFRGRVSYADIDAQVAGLDIWERCMGGDNSAAKFEWLAPSTILEGDLEQFGLEHSFLEAMQAICEPLGLVGCDQPGGYFRVFQPLGMDPNSGGTLHGTWGEGNYPRDPGFTFGETSRNIYNNVVVFRRSENYAGGSEAGAGKPGMSPLNDKWVPEEWYGSGAETESNASGDPILPPESEYAVYAERPVGTQEFRRRPYIVADFPGEQVAAQALAEKIAASLNVGVGRFEIEVFPCDYALYDLFGVERSEQVITGTAVTGPTNNVLYACQIEEISLNIAPSTYRMTLSGAASERSRNASVPGGMATGQSTGVA